MLSVDIYSLAPTRHYLCITLYLTHLLPTFLPAHHQPSIDSSPALFPS